MSAQLERKAVEAETRVALDRGEFSAFAATYDVDRVQDRIRFGAFENTIARWLASGKRLPVHWAHMGEAENVIGSVDPATMREVAGLGLYVEGKLDLDDSEVARGAWRSMKDNRVALSFGYMTVKSQSRDGLNELLELDLFEISIAPHPANPHTRILEMKSVAALERQQRDLRRRCDQIALEVALGWQPIPRPAEPEAKAAPTEEEIRRRSAELGLPLPPRRTADPDAIRVRARNQMFALLMFSDNGQPDG